MAKIPEITAGNLKRYVEQGLHPGQFLASVLANNVFGAFEYADDENRKAIGELIAEIKKKPGGCWGSQERVSEWIRHRGMEGIV